MAESGEDEPEIKTISRAPKDALAEEPDEPPVVARLVVEIRSDGSRTIARGAMEDVHSGERVAVEAKGTTPLALASSLARTMLDVPALAAVAAKSLVNDGTGKSRRARLLAKLLERKKR